MLSNRAITNCDECSLGRAAPLQRCAFGAFARPADVVLCSQGERPRTVYFVKAGLVSLSAVNSRGAEMVRMIRGPSTLLCTEAMRGQPSRYEVRSLTRVRLCGVLGEQLAHWVGADSSPARAVLDLMLQEDQVQHVDLHLREGPCLARVARFALTYASFLDERPDAVPKSVLAKTLAMRPETLSRCLSRLEGEGAVDASEGLRVRDERLLSTIASQCEAVSRRREL